MYKSGHEPGVGVMFGLSILFTIIAIIVLTEPRSTSCETYQHSTNFKEHKVKLNMCKHKITKVRIEKYIMSLASCYSQ